jgi:hypothetical protein
MKKLLFALILTALCASFAAAQYVVGPGGIITPNGALHYVVPQPYVYMGATPFGAYPYHMPLYPLSYPMVPVPVAPMWGTADDLPPSNIPMQ